MIVKVKQISLEKIMSKNKKADFVKDLLDVLTSDDTPLDELLKGTPSKKDSTENLKKAADIVNKGLEQEMEKIINSMNLKDSDSMISQICTLIYGLYVKNDWETAIENLQNISKNNKISPKLFNLIGVSLMSKGVFDEAAKIFNLGKEMCEKNGDVNSDYSCLLVNLITCYRNLGKSDEMKNIEESLKKNDPGNNYFVRCAEFDEEFTKALTN